MSQQSAEQLLGKDLDTFSGNVYMSPQTRLRDNDGYTSLQKSDEQEGLSSPFFKAKLVLSDDVTRSIGELRGNVSRVACRVHLDHVKAWSSSMRFEIKAFETKDSPILGLTRQEELVHVWVFRLDATTNITAKPLFYMFLSGIFSLFVQNTERQISKSL